MKKEQILSEIKRTATENGGTPLGQDRFAKATGIPKSNWHGKYWRNWSEAVREAGYTPNVFQEATDLQMLFKQYADLVREIGRIPTEADLMLRRRQDINFSSAAAFRSRLGFRQSQIMKTIEFCKGLQGYEDVMEICENALLTNQPVEEQPRNRDDSYGYVYLARSGRFYKIGRTDDYARRKKELTVVLPEGLETVHVISTDDPPGIEVFRHKRFADKRGKGEWFELSIEDVRAFRRRKFM